MNEAHFNEIERALLHLSDAARRVERTAADREGRRARCKFDARRSACKWSTFSALPRTASTICRF